MDLCLKTYFRHVLTGGLERDLNSYHGLINRICSFVRKDAGGQTGHHLDDTHFMCCLQHIIVDVDVVSLQEMGTSAAESIHKCRLVFNRTEDLYTKKSRLHFMFLKSPPTIAARWMTCVGRCFLNTASVSSAFLWRQRFNMFACTENLPRQHFRRYDVLT